MMPSNVHFVKNNIVGKTSKKTVSIDDFLATEATLRKPSSSPTSPQRRHYTKRSRRTSITACYWGEVRNMNLAVVDQFGVKGFPTVVVIPAGAEGAVCDSKMNNLDRLKHFPKSSITVDQTIAEIASQSATHDPLPIYPWSVHPDDPPNLVPGDPLTAVAHATTFSLLASLKRRVFDLGPGQSSFRLLIDASRVDKIINKFDIPADFPALVVMRLGKKMYRPFIGACEEQDVQKWLEDIMGGRIGSWKFEGEIVTRDRFVAASEKTK
ncbi:hypothetical protein BC938DRAFT_481246 [Jimgerdemannia flammicorona]|uniref:Thioredoxin domain-containing protein n=1 Tax=Jimgerdemannia flammicorona TaxID=994334 RepID=A0A433QGL9_9FUNG|nr:hypothetical protein BC938DRAFT_481246 [Jimgerdemannia flammicorona]